MAQRPFFRVVTVSNNGFFKEESTDFTFYSGFSISQKRKCITSLHEAIKLKYPDAKILEVSRKGELDLGNQLSAFNLTMELTDKQKYSVENIFQSSKVFENGGPYRDLLYVTPLEAKRDERLKNSGPLKYFHFSNINWELTPKSFFYDYIYIKALSRKLSKNDELTKTLMEYDTFTDIEFNPKTQFNCQARAVAILVSIKKQGQFVQDYLNNKEMFMKLYKDFEPSFELH